MKLNRRNILLGLLGLLILSAVSFGIYSLREKYSNPEFSYFVDDLGIPGWSAGGLMSLNQCESICINRRNVQGDGRCEGYSFVNKGNNMGYCTIIPYRNEAKLQNAKPLTTNSNKFIAFFK